MTAFKGTVFSGIDTSNVHLLGYGSLATAQSLDASRTRMLSLNPPGVGVERLHYNGGSFNPRTYGDLLDTIMLVPEDKRRETLHGVSEVLAGRQAEAKLEHVVVEALPEKFDRINPALMRSARASLQFIDWALGGLVLERPVGTRWHEPRDAAAAGKLAICGYGPQDKSAPAPGEDPEGREIWAEGVFLVEHDWSAALRADEGGEVRWPYPLWVLEFRLSGRRVCLLLVDGEAMMDEAVKAGITLQRGRNPYMLVFVETKYEGWGLVTTHDFIDGRWVRYGARRHALEAMAEDALLAVVAPQLRAMCIALDAEVVEREVVRAPQKLNRARERSGKGPVADHTVLNLARRHRADRSPERADEEKRRSPRLHFRRGHWRHYDNRRVWINWQLVGDPDLGFVDKHYRL